MKYAVHRRDGWLRERTRFAILLRAAAARTEFGIERIERCCVDPAQGHRADSSIWSCRVPAAVADRFAVAGVGILPGSARDDRPSRGPDTTGPSARVCARSAQQACADRESWVVLRPRGVGTDWRWWPRRRHVCSDWSQEPDGRADKSGSPRGALARRAAPERLPDLHRRQRGRSTGNLGGHTAPVARRAAVGTTSHFIAVVATSDRRGHRQDRPPYPSGITPGMTPGTTSVAWPTRRMLGERPRPTEPANWDTLGASFGTARYETVARKSRRGHAVVARGARSANARS